MKKVVVVVNEETKEWFSGDISVLSKDYENLTSEQIKLLPNPLIVKDKGKRIAVFNHWLYWRVIE